MSKIRGARPGASARGERRAAWALVLAGGAALVVWMATRRPRREHEDARMERRRLRSILDALPVGVFISAADGRMLEVNPAVREIWEMDEPPLLTRPREYGRYVAFRTDTGEPVRSEEWGTSRVLATGKPTAREELEVETFAGRRKTILHWAAPIRDRAGEVVEAVAVNVDVTNRKRAEQERERLLARERRARAEAERRARQEAELREAVSALTEPLTVNAIVDEIVRHALRAVDADAAVVTQVDEGEIEMVGAAGQVGFDVVGRRAPYSGSITQHVLEIRKPISYPAGTPFGPKGADLCPGCSLTAVPLLDGGAAMGSLLLFRSPGRDELEADEVSRAHTFGDLAALALRRAHILGDATRRREELERVTESRARLVRGFSHDLRNPLGAADGFAQVLEQEMLGPLTDPQRRGVERIRKAIGRAVLLIDQLLELARAEAGEIQLELTPTDVREAASEIGEEHRAQAEMKGLAMTIELPERFPLIPSDASRIRQILGNLIANAVKYTESGSVVVRVAVREAPFGPGEWVAVDVADTGPGIAPDQQRLIFEEFARSRPHTARGVGLGLAISRRIARALGGDLTVESGVAGGSTFTLWLPCAPIGRPHAR